MNQEEQTGTGQEALSVVSGVVTYRERIMLHPQSVLRVQVQDVSRVDAPATVLGEQVYKTEGKQVPLPFRIPYDAAAIDPRFTYSVSARILDPAGKLQFISDTITPVITRDNPTSEIVINLVSARR